MKQVMNMKLPNGVMIGLTILYKSFLIKIFNRINLLYENNLKNLGVIGRHKRSQNLSLLFQYQRKKQSSSSQVNQFIQSLLKNTVIGVMRIFLLKQHLRSLQENQLKMNGVKKRL